MTASTAVKLTKPHVLYAQWTVAPSVTVRFNAMGGTVGPDGRPAVAWEPELPADEAARRVYTTYGRAALDGTWRDLSTLDAAARARCRFFKVGVRMK